MMLMTGIGIDFIATDVWKYSLAVARILCDQGLHYSEIFRLAFRRSCIVERKAHAKQIRSDERLPRIRDQRRWRCIEISFYQIGGNASDSSTVEDWQLRHSLRDVYDGHDYSSFAGPSEAPGCSQDGAVSRKNSREDRTPAYRLGR